MVFSKYLYGIKLSQLWPIISQSIQISRFQKQINCIGTNTQLYPQKIIQNNLHHQSHHILQPQYQVIRQLPSSVSISAIRQMGALGMCEMGYFRVGNILKFDSTSQNLMQPLFYSPQPIYRSAQESQKQQEETSLPRQLFLLAAINEQFMLTQHLIQNQFRLCEQLKKEKQSSDSGQSSLPNNNNLLHRQSVEEEEDFKFASGKQDDDSSSHKSIKEQEPLTRLRIKKIFKYDVDSDSEGARKQNKRCQTKNIIKNFIKSIFNFIKRHQPYIQRILSQHQIQEHKFMGVVEELNGKINTIVELRQFWSERPYSHIYRIISSYFLRKYSLRHIFHSRISNHQVHLKYRQKLLESVSKPEDFTSLKDF